MSGTQPAATPSRTGSESTGAPNGERWEIYTVKTDSATFWDQDGSQRWDAVEGQLIMAGEQGTQCCGTDPACAQSGVCCG